MNCRRAEDGLELIKEHQNGSVCLMCRRPNRARAADGAAPDNEFFGSDANYTGAISLPQTLQSGAQESFLAINGPG